MVRTYHRSTNESSLGGIFGGEKTSHQVVNQLNEYICVFGLNSLFVRLLYFSHLPIISVLCDLSFFCVCLVWKLLFQHFADGSPVKSASDPYDVVTSIVYKPPEDEEQIKAKAKADVIVSPSPDLSTTSRAPTSRPQTRKARSRSSDSLSTIASEAAVTGGGLPSSCRRGTPSSCGVHDPALMAQLGQHGQQQQLGSFYYQAPPQPVPMGLCRNCRRIYASSPLLAESQATILTK